MAVPAAEREAAPKELGEITRGIAVRRIRRKLVKVGRICVYPSTGLVKYVAEDAEAYPRLPIDPHAHGDVDHQEHQTDSELVRKRLSTSP